MVRPEQRGECDQSSEEGASSRRESVTCSKAGTTCNDGANTYSQGKGDRDTRDQRSAYEQELTAQKQLRPC